MHVQYSNLISNTAPYTFAEVDKKVFELKQKGVKVIDFGVGDPSDPTPDFVIEAMYAGAKAHATTGYPSYIGDLKFRSACAEYVQREFGVCLDPKTEISSTIGSKEAVFHFPFGFINPGDIVICPTPGYPPYKTGTKFAGGIPYFVPLLPENNFLIDLDVIPEEICEKAKIIWTNYPNSPTGKLAPRQWLEKLIAWAQKYNIIIAADEGCYIDIYFDQKPLSILEITKNGVIAFYSLSKRNNMTGYRVGFVAGDEEIISGFRQIKTNIDSGTPNFVQVAAVAALEDVDHAHQMCQEYQKKQKILMDALRSIGLPQCPSEGTFYIWQEAEGGMTGSQLAKNLLEIGIVVTPGTWISDEAEGGIIPGENYVRFALVCTMEEVKEAAERIKKLGVISLFMSVKKGKDKFGWKIS